MANHQVTYGELLNEVANYLGFQKEADPYTPVAWSATEVLTIDSIVQRGYRQFLYPPVMPQKRMSHSWAFLKPTQTLWAWSTITGTVSTAVHLAGVTTLTATASVFYPSVELQTITFTVSGNTYPIAGYTLATIITLTGNASAEVGAFSIASNGIFTLPDTFNGIIGDLTYASKGISRAIKLVSDGVIRNCQERSYGTTSGYPTIGAIRPIAGTGATAQRYQLIVYPEAGGNYELQYKGSIDPPELSSTYPYPYGSGAHSETILASCIALAELEVNDVIGARYQRFMERLMASISNDAYLAASPTTLGYNGNRTFGRYGINPNTTVVTYTGYDV